jgi:serine/threonine protein kinase
MRPQLAVDPTARRRFEQEARAMAAVQHPTIVTVHAVGSIRMLPYLVMEFIDGESLSNRLKSGALDERTTLEIGQQIAAGLAAAHDSGLIHRDIKPANILIDQKTGGVKITDFGLSRLGDAPELTRTGYVAGTPEYMSPEQAEGKALDLRSDLFSLGTVLYEACTGSSPFHGETVFDSLQKVREARITPLRELTPSLSPILVDVIEKLLRREQDERFATAREILDALGGTERSPPSTANRTARLRRIPLWLIASTAATLVLVALSGAWLAYERFGSQSPSSLLSSSPGALRMNPNLPSADAKNSTAARFVLTNGNLDFPTLAEAIAAAEDGDVIQISSHDPIPCRPVSISGKRLHLRAAP